MRTCIFALAVGLALAASRQALTAHRFRSLTTTISWSLDRLIRNEPYTTLTPPVSVYVIPMRQFNGVWYVAAQQRRRSDPNAGGVSVGTGIGVWLRPGRRWATSVCSRQHIFREFHDGLKRWNGSDLRRSGDRANRSVSRLGGCAG